jgi:ZIP family zinc transporter
MQGLAGGLMLSISVFDLFQESQEAVGTLWANVWFFAGVIFFAAVVHFIPEPDSANLVIEEDEEEEEEEPTVAKGGRAAAGSTPVRR